MVMHQLFFVMCIDNDGEMLNRALVQYAFDEGEHCMLNRPHGNSKRKEGFIRTLQSTLHQLKAVSSNLTPKFAVQSTTDAVGGQHLRDHFHGIDRKLLICDADVSLIICMGVDVTRILSFQSC